jgi:hypothetical protein
MSTPTIEVIRSGNESRRAVVAPVNSHAMVVVVPGMVVTGTVVLGMVVLGMVVPGRVVPGTLVDATVVTSAVVVTRVVGTPVVETPGALVVTADSEVLHDGATRVSAVTATGANQGRMAETSRVMVVAAGADGQGRRSSPVTVAVAVGSHEYSKCLYRGKDLH